MKEIRSNQETTPKIQEIPQTPASSGVATSMKPMRSMVGKKSVRPLRVFTGVKLAKKK